MGCCSSCSNANAGSDGILKFSGFVATSESGASLASYLADAGFADDSTSTVNRLNYPMPLERTLKGMSVNLPSNTLTIGQTVFVQLLKNGVPVPGFNVAYGEGDGGVKNNPDAPRTTFKIGDTFEVRVSTFQFSGGIDIPILVAIGVV